MANVFTTFLGNMEESSSVCATAVGGSSAIPHMPSLSHCHGSLTLGENEHSKRFPPQYYLSLFFLHLPCSLSAVSPPHTSILYCPWGGQRFNSTASPLWLWINVHHTETGKDRKYISLALNPASLDFCETAGWQSKWARSSMCLMSRHGLKLQSHGGHLLYFTW